MIKVGMSAIVLAGFLMTGLAGAEYAGPRQDSKAVEVLKSMSTFNESLDRFTIESISLTDARLGGGLMVTNTAENKMSIDRPGSAHVSHFDGVETKELFFHEGLFTVYGSEKNYYAQAQIPNDLDAAVEFTMEELEVDAPLMDLMYRDASRLWIDGHETILYLTDKARVAGTDCHHLVIRSAESDVQLWVQEGEQPLLRKIIITSKWEGGSPRFVANLSWNLSPDFDSQAFIFKAPDDAVNIGFRLGAEEGE